MERKKVTKSTILDYRAKGMTAVEIATELGMTSNEYSTTCKLLGIKGRAKSSINKKFEIVDDTKGDTKDYAKSEVISIN